MAGIASKRDGRNVPLWYQVLHGGSEATIA